MELGVPPKFVLAIAYAEHWNGSIEETIIRADRRSPINSNGSRDLGVMQLNSKYYCHVNWWDAEVNIRTGVQHIKWLMEHCATYWEVAVAYNCGLDRSRGGPPKTSLNYASNVMDIWHELEGYDYVNLAIRK